MKTPTPMLDELASRCNPIIGYNPADTLHNAACVTSFLTRLQLDRSEGLFQEETSGTAGPDSLTANETRGLYFITSALAAALWFEVEGRPNEGGTS